MTKLLRGMLLAAVVFAGVASAEELGVSVTADYFGKYIWRGQNLQDDGVFQPGAELSLGNITAGIWGNVDLTNYNGESGEFTEIDYYADYSADLCDGIGYSIGVINYTFPNPSGVDDATELYAGLSFDTVLSPSVTLYNYADEAGSYVSFAVGHTVEDIFCSGVCMDVCASLGWGSESYNNAYWGVDESALNDLAVSVSFPIELGCWTMTPSLNYVTLMDSDIRDSDAFDTSSDYFFAGIGLSTSF